MLINTLLKHWSYRIIAPGTLLREQYEAMKQLLQHDLRCHEMMAELQGLLDTTPPEDFARVRKRFAEFSEHVAAMIRALDSMAPGKYSSLKDYHRKFDFYTRYLLAPPKINSSAPYTFPLSALPADLASVGNKTRHLSLLSDRLGLPTPGGFAITANGCHRLIEHNGLRTSIDELLATLDSHNPDSLTATSTALIGLINDATIPEDLGEEILAAFNNLLQANHTATVAVRSSALCEDSDTSFAGQFTTVLNVSRDDLLDSYRQVIASQYSPEALYYRIRQGLGDEETAMSVLVVEMVSARCSGVIYTADIHEGDKHDTDLHLHIVDGLGEKLVGGMITPEHLVLSRKDILGSVKLLDHEKMLSDKECRALCTMALSIEKHFGVPQDIEWAIDTGGAIYFLQARKMQAPGDDSNERDQQAAKPDAQVLVAGIDRASRGVAAGPVYILQREDELNHLPAGVVLVTENTPPDLVRYIHKFNAVLSAHGSKASHFATVAREFRIPFLCNLANATKLFRPQDQVTVDGNNGIVYQGVITELLNNQRRLNFGEKYRRKLEAACKFITPLELVDPAAKNFSPEGCRSMHDIIRFSHETALRSLFSTDKPGTGRGSTRLIGDIPLDVYLFDVGGGLSTHQTTSSSIALSAIRSVPFLAIWRGLSHPGVQWKQKPFDWEAYDRIELTGGVPPNKESFAFASYAVVGNDYLHFNIRFGYHFTIIDALCGETASENHCMLRFAGGGGDYEHRSLRIDFLEEVMKRIGLRVDKRGDLLEAQQLGVERHELENMLDILGRLLGATKLMDMVLADRQMVLDCVDEFFNGRYSFSQEG